MGPNDKSDSASSSSMTKCWDVPRWGQTTSLSVPPWFSSSSRMMFWCSREKRVWDACAPPWGQTTGLSVLSSINSSDFHSWEDQFLSIFYSEQLDECAFSTSRWRSWPMSRQTTSFPVLSYISACALRGLWLSCLVFSGLSDAVDDRADGALSLLRAIKLIIDFAVTLSSPDSFCVLFDITSEHSSELKWLMFIKHKRWFLSSHVKFHLVNMSASWFLVSMYLIWILEVQIDSIEQPIKSYSVGSGNMSHCRTLSFNDHLDHCFVVFKHIQQSFLMRKSDVWGNKVNIIPNIDNSWRLVAHVILITANNGTLRSVMVLSCACKDWNDQIP